MQDIYDILEGLFGIYRGTTNPSEIRYNCTFCPDGDVGYHLYVNIDSYLYNCFRCPAKGHLSKLIEGRLPKTAAKREARTYESLIPIDSFAPIEGSSSEIAKWCADYLKGRGILDMSNIWYGTKGEWLGRVVFPVIEFGKIVFAVGRSIVDDEPKYLNTAGSRKSTFIYRLDGMIYSPYIIITEGPIDALSTENAVALLGKELSASQEAKIRMVIPQSKPIYIALDGDARTEAIKVAYKLRGVYPNLYFCVFPIGEDLNSVNGGWQDYPVVPATTQNLVKLKLGIIP